MDSKELQAQKWKEVKELQKKLSLVRLGDKVGVMLPSISTGLMTFDYNVIQTGGVPRGRLVEVFGPESSGKTSFSLHVIGREQKMGGICAFIDAEHALDPSWAAKLGVDVDNLLVSQPDCGEEALQTVDALVTSGAVSLIVVDSVAALTPRAELEGEIGDAHVGLQARMMAQACRILSGKCMKNQVTILFINQIREKIGVMFGNPETTPGGRALKFYASVRLDVRRLSKGIKENDVLTGHEIKLKAVKNKVGIPFRETTVSLLYNEDVAGFDTSGDYAAYAVSVGAIQQKGAWFSFDGENIAQGMDSLKGFLGSSPEVVVKIDKKIQEMRFKI